MTALLEVRQYSLSTLSPPQLLVAEWGSEEVFDCHHHGSCGIAGGAGLGRGLAIPAGRPGAWPSSGPRGNTRASERRRRRLCARVWYRRTQQLHRTLLPLPGDTAEWEPGSLVPCLLAYHGGRRGLCMLRIIGGAGRDCPPAQLPAVPACLRLSSAHRFLPHPWRLFPQAAARKLESPDRTGKPGAAGLASLILVPRLVQRVSMALPTRFSGRSLGGRSGRCALPSRLPQARSRSPTAAEFVVW